LTTFPNNEKKGESTMCSAVFLMNIKVFGNVVKNGLRCLNDVSCRQKLKLGRKERNDMEILEMLIRSDIQHAKKTNLQVCITMYRVCTGPGKPGKSWNFIVAFSRTGKSWKRATGSGKFWKSVKLK